MPKKTILIDYENVQPDISMLIDDQDTHVLIFVGSQQEKVSFDIAASLQKMGNRAEYIKINGTSNNALDFHIAYYIGKMVTQNPSTQFHIISKDKGFDPLIKHLQERKTSVTRSETLEKTPAPKVKPSTKSKISIVTEGLKKRGVARPKTLKTLATTINAMFQNKLKPNDVDNLIKALQQKEYIEIKDTKVSYKLPS